MKWTRNILIGCTLLIVGGIIFLNAIGLHAGWLIRMAIAFLIFYYGVRKIKNAETTFQKGVGIALVLFAGLMFIGAAHLFFGIAIAFALVYLGLKLIKNEPLSTPRKQALTEFESCAAREQEDEFDIEWNKRMNKKIL